MVEHLDLALALIDIDAGIYLPMQVADLFLLAPTDQYFIPNFGRHNFGYFIDSETLDSNVIAVLVLVN